MRRTFLTLASLALVAVAAGPASTAAELAPPKVAAKPARQNGAKPAARARPPAVPRVAKGLAPSPEVQRVADWVAASGDNRGLPYIIVDKKGAQLLLYTGAGELLAEQPVLLGIAPGDLSSPGVGAKNLAEIGPAEKTTPAGRFLARFGAVGRQKVLWVDYADSVALHPIPPTANPREQRKQRMLSPASNDNRITFGCINVPGAVYTRGVVPLFRKQGGYVYILPDDLALEDVFPLLRTRTLVQAMPVAAEPAPTDNAGTEVAPAR